MKQLHQTSHSTTIVIVVTLTICLFVSVLSLSVLSLSVLSPSPSHLQALPPGAMQPLPKRPSLEKSNGAAAVFNPSMFHYQQALANMQIGRAHV